jgi:Cu(I)/Ag(I) efflux system membrane fusion protein
MSTISFGSVRRWGVAAWVSASVIVIALAGCGSSGEEPIQDHAQMKDMDAARDQGSMAEHGNTIAYYTCPMHPSVKQPDPGTCPLCGMDLVSVTEQEVDTGVVIVDGARRQQIGVRLARVERRPFSMRVRAVGKVVYDETRLTDVAPRVGGWIGELYADATGKAVRRGEPLFTLYSPELVSAQEEYLAALAGHREAQGTTAPGRADYLVQAARRRLSLWDLTPTQIEEIGRRETPLDQVPILSPVSGYVVEKNVVAGAAFRPGEKLFRIAGLDRVWIEAELYESQLSVARVGLPADVTLSYLPGVHAAGRIAFVYPYLDPKTRTGRVRVELDNPDLEMKPDMYANVEFRVERGPRLAVPESAVLYAGDRRAVFVNTGEDRFEPRIIEVGIGDDDYVEVLSGLSEGEEVVASGNFLIAAESRLKTSMERWK